MRDIAKRSGKAACGRYLQPYNLFPYERRTVTLSLQSSDSALPAFISSHHETVLPESHKQTVSLRCTSLKEADTSSTDNVGTKTARNMLNIQITPSFALPVITPTR